ncbi:MAG: class B sortase [Oscillospiraceae bacterium]|nr:class B sortase [Oscillospiraceae bacterium]
MKSKLLKIAAVISAAALIAGGIYFLFHDDLAQKISYEKLKPFMPNVTVLSVESTEQIKTKDKVELKKQVRELNQSYDSSIGWICVPDTNINYPIMQWEDNEYYLHRSYDGSYLYSGSVFLDWRCSSDFSGDVNMLYGHNMQNGSMFADVVNFINEDYFDSHRYGWLTTKDSVYKIEFFSVSQPQSYSGVYNVLRSGDKWLRKLKSCSFIFKNLQISEDDSVISLSTCTNSEGSSRTVLTGKLVEV